MVLTMGPRAAIPNVLILTFFWRCEHLRHAHTGLMMWTAVGHNGVGGLHGRRGRCGRLASGGGLRAREGMAIVLWPPMSCRSR
ncbi:hypothetical protein BJY52DRAFT_1299171 [Lactarius psammicola]|nr:hypothetical protein BJY52DRAFT_1299171 [Lactarius psammicola]